MILPIIISQARKWRKTPKKRLLHIGVAGAIMLLCVASIGYLYLRGFARPSAIHEINLTETGFAPNTITIAKGDIVVFTTRRGKPFWPASDLHPTHEIYSEFDPKEPIEPNASWSFRFENTGEWKYHDHLDSYYKGVTRVTSEKDEKKATLPSHELVVNQTVCDNASATAGQLQCWQGVISQKLRENNLDGAFSALDLFLEQNPSQLGACHGITHEIGQKSYELFNRRVDFSLSPKTSYCGYGFYHGFMETLLHTTNDIAQARIFCDEINRYTIVDTQKSQIACLHGFGHGLLDEAIITRHSGSLQSLIGAPLLLCEKISNEVFKIELCATGVFNALSIALNSSLYKNLKVDQDEPYKFCDRQTRTYFKKACYQEFATVALKKAEGDFSEATKYVEEISENSFAIPAMENLAASATLSRITRLDFADFIAICHALQRRLGPACLQGIAGTLLEQGPPEYEYKSVLQFCSSPSLLTHEKEDCIKTMMSLAYVNYSSKKYQSVCHGLEDQFKKYCL